jgi:creatinine amidohydrolase
MIIPAGAVWPRAEHLPLGSDLLILDHVADDLSRRLEMSRAPVIPFGVHAPRARRSPGAASLTRKTLHRTMNELIASWHEEAGVRNFLVLTAHAEEPHQEALSTIRTGAVVRVVDILEMDIRTPKAADAIRRGDESTDLLLHLAPTLVRSPAGMPDATAAAAARGAALYELILDRLQTLGGNWPPEEE